MIVFSCWFFFFSILSIKNYEVHAHYTTTFFLEYSLRQKKKLLLALFFKPVYQSNVANHLSFYGMLLTLTQFFFIPFFILIQDNHFIYLYKIRMTTLCYLYIWSSWKGKCFIFYFVNWISGLFQNKYTFGKISSFIQICNGLWWLNQFTWNLFGFQQLC